MTLQRRSVTIHLSSAQIKVESGRKSGIILPHPARCFQLRGTDRGEQTTPIEEIGRQLYTLRSGTPLVLETIQHLVSPQFLTHHSSHTDQCHSKFSYAAIHVFPLLYRSLMTNGADRRWQTDRRHCCFRPFQPLVRSGVGVNGSLRPLIQSTSPRKNA